VELARLPNSVHDRFRLTSELRLDRAQAFGATAGEAEHTHWILDVVDQSEHENDVELSELRGLDLENVRLAELERFGRDVEVVSHDRGALEVLLAHIHGNHSGCPPVEKPLREPALVTCEIESGRSRAAGRESRAHSRLD
jgi:hypothetical protein